MGRVNIAGTAFRAWFDPDKATQYLAKTPMFVDGTLIREKLYRTASGRWVHSGADGHEYVTDDWADTWLSTHGHTPDEPASHDTAGPGRPEIGGIVQVRLGELLPELDSVRGDTSRALAVREAVRFYLEHRQNRTVKMVPLVSGQWAWWVPGEPGTHGTAFRYDVALEQAVEATGTAAADLPATVTANDAAEYFQATGMPVMPVLQRVPHGQIAPDRTMDPWDLAVDGSSSDGHIGWAAVTGAGWVYTGRRALDHPSSVQVAELEALVAGTSLYPTGTALRVFSDSKSVVTMVEQMALVNQSGTAARKILRRFKRPWVPESLWSRVHREIKNREITAVWLPRNKVRLMQAADYHTRVNQQSQLVLGAPWNSDRMRSIATENQVAAGWPTTAPFDEISYEPPLL